MKSELTSLGLTENQSKVYEKLLFLGKTNAGILIKQTGLHRAIVYDCLEKLTKKGIIAYIIIKNVKQYEVIEPKEFERYLKEEKQNLKKKEETINKIKEKIKEKSKKSGESANARIYHGKRGLKTVFDGIVTNKKEILIFATGWGMKETMRDYFYQWHLKLKKNKIKGRALVNNKINLTEKYPYKIKYLQEEHILPSTIIVQGEKVINVIWEIDPITIVVESPEVSKSYKEYFEVLWKIASFK